MNEYVYLYRGGTMPTVPDEAKANMQKWIDWMTALGKQGHLKDRGNRLEPGGRTVKNGAGSITDGPFAEAKDVIGGYTIVTAKDLAQATELSKTCPIFAQGGYVEVRPVLAM